MTLSRERAGERKKVQTFELGERRIARKRSRISGGERSISIRRAAKETQARRTKFGDTFQDFRDRRISIGERRIEIRERSSVIGVRRIDVGVRFPFIGRCRMAIRRSMQVSQGKGSSIRGRRIEIAVGAVEDGRRRIEIPSPAISIFRRRISTRVRGISIEERGTSIPRSPLEIRESLLSVRHSPTARGREEDAKRRRPRELHDMLRREPLAQGSNPLPPGAKPHFGLAEHRQPHGRRRPRPHVGCSPDS